MYRDEPHVSTSKVNVFECLFTRAMDHVEATGEGSQNVSALVTCGFFYIVAITREPNSSGEFAKLLICGAEAGRGAENGVTP